MTTETKDGLTIHRTGRRADYLARAEFVRNIWEACDDGNVFHIVDVSMMLDSDTGISLVDTLRDAALDTHSHGGRLAVVGHGERLLRLIQTHAPQVWLYDSLFAASIDLGGLMKARAGLVAV